MAVNSFLNMNLLDKTFNRSQKMGIMRERIRGSLRVVIGIYLSGLFPAIFIVTVPQHNDLHGASRRLPDPMAGTDIVGLKNSIAQYHYRRLYRL